MPNPKAGKVSQKTNDDLIHDLAVAYVHCKQELEKIRREKGELAYLSERRGVNAARERAIAAIVKHRMIEEASRN